MRDFRSKLTLIKWVITRSEFSKNTMGIYFKLELFLIFLKSLCTVVDNHTAILKGGVPIFKAQLYKDPHFTINIQ